MVVRYSLCCAEKMKTLFLFIPNFTFTSDLLHTNFIKSLAEKFRVVVFSPVFESNDSSQYFQSPNVEYLKWDVEHPKFWLLFTKTLRLTLIREFDNLEYLKLRWREKINWSWKRRMLKYLSWFLPRSLTTADFFTKLEKFLLPNSKKFQAHLKKYNPAILLTCTPGFSTVEAETIILAKKNGLPTASIDSSWDNYTSNSVQIRKTDYLVCWNKQMKKEAVELHRYPENKIFISGTYRFDHHFQKREKEISRDEFLKSKSLDPNRKTLLICTLPPNTYPHQYKVWREIVRMWQRGEFVEPLNLFFRIHPNDEPKRYEEFKNVPNLHIEMAGHSLNALLNTAIKVEMNKSDLDNLYYSLKYTDININFRSSLNLETVIYGTPSINLALYGYLPRYHVDWYIPIVESGGIKLVTTEEELKSAISGYLKNPTKDSTGRKKIYNEYVIFSDGLSYQRSVAAIEKIVSELKRDQRLQNYPR